jgi:Ca2+ regulator and membrane fusion protein Fig1
VSQNGTGNATDGTVCVPTFGFNATDLSNKLFGQNGDDVVPILELALTLQRKILVPIILIASFLMLFGAIFFALAKVTQMKLKDPNTFESAIKQLKIFKPVTLAMLWISVMLAFAAAVASSMSVGALNFIIPVLATNISVTGGKMLQALQYLSFFLGALFALGATIMLGDKLEQQEGMTPGEEYPSGGEKSLDDESYDESMMQQGEQQGMEGMEGQEQQYPEGEYPPEQQEYAEGQEYPQEGQPYPDGGEYPQQEEYGEQPDQQQQYQQQQPYP